MGTTTPAPRPGHAARDGTGAIANLFRPPPRPRALLPAQPALPPSNGGTPATMLMPGAGVPLPGRQMMKNDDVSGNLRRPDSANLTPPAPPPAPPSPRPRLPTDRPPALADPLAPAAPRPVRPSPLAGKPPDIGRAFDPRPGLVRLPDPFGPVRPVQDLRPPPPGLPTPRTPLVREDRPAPASADNVAEARRRLSPAERQAKVDDAYRRVARGLAALPPPEQARRLADAAAIAGALPSPIVAWVNGVLAANGAASSQPSPNAAARAARIVAETGRADPNALAFVAPGARVKAGVIGALLESGIDPADALAAADGALAGNPALLQQAAFRAGTEARTRGTEEQARRDQAAADGTTGKTPKSRRAFPPFLSETITPDDAPQKTEQTSALSLPSASDPWRGRAFDQERENQLISILDEIEGATPDRLSILEQKIEEAFFEAPEIVSALKLVTRGKAGQRIAGETAIDPGLSIAASEIEAGHRQFVGELRRRIEAGQHFDSGLESDRKAFAAFEDRSGLSLSENEDGKLGVATGGNETAPLFSLERGTVRAIANSDVATRATLLLADFLTGRIDRKTYEMKAAGFSEGIDLHVFGDLAQSKITDMLLDARDLVAFSQNPNSVAALVTAAFNPDAILTESDLRDILLDILPVVGEIRAIEATGQDLESMVTAIRRGEWDNALMAGIMAGIGMASVAPGVGALFRGVRNVVGKTFRRLFLFRGATFEQIDAFEDFYKAVVQGTKGPLKSRKPRDVFGSTLDDLPPETRAIVEEIFNRNWSNMVGEIGELDMARIVTQAGGTLRRGKNTPGGFIHVEGLGGRRPDGVLNFGESGILLSLLEKITPSGPTRRIALEMKMNSADLKKLQKAKDDRINARDPSVVNLEVDAIVLLRKSIDDVPEGVIHEVTQKYLARTIGDEAMIEEIGQTLLAGLRRQRAAGGSDDVTLGVYVTALAALTAGIQSVVEQEMAREG